MWHQPLKNKTQFSDLERRLKYCQQRYFEKTAADLHDLLWRLSEKEMKSQQIEASQRWNIQYSSERFDNANRGTIDAGDFGLADTASDITDFDES